MFAHHKWVTAIFSRIVTRLRFTSKFKASDAVQERREERNARVGVNFSSALTKVPPGTSLIGNTNITIYILILLSNLMARAFVFRNHDEHVPKKCYQLNALLFLKEENLRKEFHQYFFHTRIYAFHPKFAFFAASKTFFNRP